MNEPHALLPWIDPPPGGYRRLIQSLDNDRSAGSETVPSMILAPVASFLVAWVLAIGWIPSRWDPVALNPEAPVANENRPPGAVDRDNGTDLALLVESNSGIRLYAAILRDDATGERRP